MRKVLTLDGVLAAGAAAALMLSGCVAGDDMAVDQTDQELAGAAAGDIIPGSYIFVLHDDGLQTAAADYGLAQAQARGAAVGLLARHGLPEAAVDRVYGSALRGFSANMSAAQAQRLAKDPAVKYFEPDRVVTLLAPTFESGVGTLAQSTPYGITRVGGPVNYSGSNRAYVIDTGIDLDHPDLNVDTGRSRNFARGPNNPDDGNGHGTHVAGTIAAKNDSNGVVGVAAGAPVVAVKVLSNSGSGTTAGVISGVDYVKASASNGDVANMSLGGGASTALDDAVKSAASSGVKFALAAGNESNHANNSSPARANGNNIFTVSAINSSDVFASFSNFGNPPVDFAAPGVSVLSTYKGKGYATLSGTSMAAPHVAGVLLLGSIRSDGNAINDPDGNPDPIAHR